MREAKVRIRNRTGLHARSAALLVQTANKFRSEIKIEKDGQEVNGKSILNVMMLAAARGTQLILRAEGEDEEKALAELKKLVDNRFGEE
jgi:phosphotransferase system HPr (HPr) family protein